MDPAPDLSPGPGLDESGRCLRVAVNLSAVQLRQPDFAVLVERALADSGLASSALEFEVTESVFLDPSKIAITKTLHEVAEMGVHLAIDDFGTGYSSLGYLKHFPFDRIKIDASFVRDIGAEANAEAIVKAIIALGRSLGKSVTAEGVETELQLAFLRRHTCDEAQATCSLDRCRRPKSNERSRATPRSAMIPVSCSTRDAPCRGRI